MKKFLVLPLLLAGISGAQAADLPTVATPVVATPAAALFDVAFGASVASDYVLRGISQSGRGAAVSGYFEGRVGWFYAGIAGYSVKLATDPTAEIDLTVGVRPTWGNFTLDAGFVYYYYPHEIPFAVNGVGNTDFWEIYAKPSYVINDIFTVSGGIQWTPDFAASGADGTYLTGALKATLPLTTDVGAYISGELGYQWLGRTDVAHGLVSLPDYLTWNVGAGLTYKALTLDFRYYDTDLSRFDCGFLALKNTYCDATFVVKLSADSLLSALK